MTAIIVTRPQGAADPLAADLAAHGYRVHAVPTVATEAMAVTATDLKGFDWIIVTSAAGVAALPFLPRSARWAAVGTATAAALEAQGISAEVVPEPANGEALAKALPDAAGRRVLLARADAAAGDLPEILRARGAEVVELAVYRTVEGPERSRAALATALADPRLGAVVFASGSAARGFLVLGGGTGVPVVTIGPRTSEAARAAGFAVVAEAREQTTAALAQAVLETIPLEVDGDEHA